MLKDISKKLTMKKTFFVTQLEGFFNAVSQEYQELIQEKEVENSLLKEQNNELQKDIKNLVAIKQEMLTKLAIEKKHITTLQDSLEKFQDANDETSVQKLLEENKILKAKLTTIQGHESQDQEINILKQKVKKLQGIISKGANAYNNNMTNQNTEAIIEEISKSIKK